jgi:hypothetical protein
MCLRLAPTNTIKVVNLSLVVLWLGAAFLSPAQAEDVITFKNGDRLTGTIKYLDRGRLIVKSRLLDGDAKVDWKQVVRVESDRLFQLQTIAGERFLGRIGKEAGTGESSDELVILMGSSEQKLRRNRQERKERQENGWSEACAPFRVNLVSDDLGVGLEDISWKNCSKNLPVPLRSASRSSPY